MLTPASMSASIKSEIQTVFGLPVDAGRLQDFCDALGKAIVDNIHANAEVRTGIEVSPGTFTDSTHALITGLGVTSTKGFID